MKPALHCPPVGNVVPLTYTGVGGRIASGIVCVSGVLHNNCTWLGQSIAAESCRSIGTKPRCHPCACGTSPKRVVIRTHFQFFCVCENEADRPRQIFAGSLCSRTIDQGEGMISHFRQLQCLRETVTHGTYVAESSAGIAYSERRAGTALEEE